MSDYYVVDDYGIGRHYDSPSTGRFSIYEEIMDKETFIEAFKEFILPDLADMIEEYNNENNL